MEEKITNSTSPETVKSWIEQGETALGIELGSTRIKAVLDRRGPPGPSPPGTTPGRTCWRTGCGPTIWRTY